MNFRHTMMHILGHPQLPLDLPACPEDAQLQNCRHFCLLLAHLGIPYKYYGISGSKVVPGGEFVDCHRPTGRWSYRNAWHRLYNRRLSRALERHRLADGRPEWIASLYGAAQADIRDQNLPVLEPMLGYDHCWSNYRVFPSYAHQQVIYTQQQEFTWQSRFFDIVIPHFVLPEEYPLSDAQDGYLLYLGREAEDKGLSLARDCAKDCGLPLRSVFSGCQGQEKAALLGRALAVLMPTWYLEPFGYVAIEAQMCGTPVICTDWGAFPETVAHGLSGFRCRTAAEFKAGVAACAQLDRAAIRKRAVSLYSLAAVARTYADYFAFVWKSYGQGGYYAPEAIRYGNFSHLHNRSLTSTSGMENYGQRTQKEN